MAVGFPVKADYVTGDVLTAANMNDLSGTLNTIQSVEYAAGKNKIINGDFNIWQRGTSIAVPASTTGFGSDRWGIAVGTGAAVTLSRQTFTPGAAPVAGYEGNFFNRCNRTTTGSSPSYFFQRIENVTTVANNTITVSFYAKASATYTFAAAEIYLEQNFGSGGSAAVNTTLNTSTQTITTSWARYSFTISVPSISGKTIGTSSFIALVFAFATSQSTFTLDMWGVQLEQSSTASDFQTATGTLQGELAACQRYCYAITAGTNYGTRAFSSTFLYQGGIPLPVTMRSAPTLRSGGTWTANTGNNGTMALDGSATTSANLYNSATNWTTDAALNFSATFEAEL